MPARSRLGALPPYAPRARRGALTLGFVGYLMKLFALAER
jgi:hypothetical protein